MISWFILVGCFPNLQSVSHLNKVHYWNSAAQLRGWPKTVPLFSWMTSACQAYHRNAGSQSMLKITIMCIMSFSLLLSSEPWKLLSSWMRRQKWPWNRYACVPRKLPYVLKHKAHFWLNIWNFICPVTNRCHVWQGKVIVDDTDRHPVDDNGGGGCLVDIYSFSHV